MKINDLLRENIRDLQPYSCARDEFKGEASVYLDANENPYNSPYNRYPDPQQLEVKRQISKIKNIPIKIYSWEMAAMKRLICCTGHFANRVRITWWLLSRPMECIKFRLR